MAVGASWYIWTPGFGVSPAILNDYSSWGNQPVLFDVMGNRLSQPVVSLGTDCYMQASGATTADAISDFESMFADNGMGNSFCGLPRWLVVPPSDGPTTYLAAFAVEEAEHSDQIAYATLMHESHSGLTPYVHCP